MALTGAGARPSAQHLQGYVAARRAAGAADSTILNELAAVRRMYSVSGVTLPRADLRLRPPSEVGPTLHPESILRLVAWARRPDAPPLARRYIAISTLYGARVSEMAALRQEDVDLPGRRVYLWTRKDGESRWQSIPSPAAWALAGAWTPRRTQALQAMFVDACHRAGVPREDGMGWHSVRRGLAYALTQAGVPLEARHAFTRWAGGRKGEDIADYYAGATRLLSPSGWVQAQRDDPDAAAWARHPFVAAWVR